MRGWIICVGLLATPAAAQLDPVMLGQGQVMAATMRQHAHRDARRLGYRDVDHYETVQNCRKARRMARPTGALGAKLDRARVLCRRLGY